MLLLGGVALLSFIPILAVGGIFYGRIGVSSASSGHDALTRVAAAGNTFALMNGLFHLGALLLLPAIAALAWGLAGGDRTSWIILATGFGILGVTVAAGFVFPLNHGLFLLAALYSSGAPEAKAAYAAVADMNLKIQVGAELVQSVAIGLFTSFVSIAALSAGWPAWLAYLGIAAGVGFVLAGFASVLMGVRGVGQVLGTLGGIGILLFAAWSLAVGIRLITDAVTSRA